MTVAQRKTKFDNPKLARPKNGKHSNKNKKGSKNKISHRHTILEAFKVHSKGKFDLEKETVLRIIEMFENKEMNGPEITTIMLYLWSKMPAERIVTASIDLPKVLIGEIKNEEDEKIV